MKKALSLPKLRKKLTRIFNQYIRERDQKKLCISCELRPSQQAGHYWSTSQCPQPAMRFFEKNVNGQCVYCNSFLEGNRQGYREGLIKKYGPGIIKELDIKRSVKQKPWTRFEHETLINHYTKLLKRKIL